jgi:hypothetical protein
VDPTLPRRFIWDWGPKEAQHLGGGGLPDTPSAGGATPFSRKPPFPGLTKLGMGGIKLRTPKKLS